MLSEGLNRAMDSDLAKQGADEAQKKVAHQACNGCVRDATGGLVTAVLGRYHWKDGVWFSK